MDNIYMTFIKNRIKMKYGKDVNLINELGITKAAWQNWKRGIYKPSVNNMFELANKLQINIVDVLAAFYFNEYKNNTEVVKNDLQLL